MKRFLLPAIILILVVLEAFLAFRGPMAFVKKPTLLVATPYSYSLDDAEIDTVLDYLQRSIARTRSFRIIPQDLIENYYFEKEDRPEVDLRRQRSYTEYLEIARELEIERLLISSFYPRNEHIDIYLVLRNVASGEVIERLKFQPASIELFLAGKLESELRRVTPGISFFDNLFFLLLAGQLLLACALFFRRGADLLNQILISGGLLLLLFALIYAQNAGMDYVQRFIAHKGQIQLAESTLTEQIYSLLRFLPLLIVNSIYFILLRLRSDRPSSSSKGLLIRDWALPLSLAAALFSALAFPSFLSLRGFPILAWIALMPLFLVLLKSTVAVGILCLVSYSAFYTLILNYWQGTYSYISLAFTVTLSAILYLFWAVPTVLLVKAARKWGFLLAPLIWLSFDYLRSLGYIGYPWGYLGVSQYLFLPLIQVADLGGVWLITLLILYWNAAWAWSLAAPACGWSWAGRRWLPALTAVGLMMIALLYGGIRLWGPPSYPGENMRIALIQQNRDPRKHSLAESYEVAVELTRTALRESGEQPVDLVVWPEGGLRADIRYWLDRPKVTVKGAEMVRRFLDFQESIDTWLVTGTQDHHYIEISEGERKKRNFNSSVLLDDSGKVVAFYHKMHLVPFTEHFPYKEQYPWLTRLLDKFDTSDWEAGTERLLYRHPKARFFTPICFEDIFPDDVRRFVADGADLIVNMSNDYWSLNPVEGKQHGVHALLRTVENRRPMVRATASGLTTSIDAWGRLSPEFPAYYSPDYLIADLRISERGHTLYTRWGDWVPQTALIATLLAAIWILILIRLKRTRAGDRGAEVPPPT